MAFAFEPDTAAYLERFAAQPPRENQSLDDLRADYRRNLVADAAASPPGVHSRGFTIGSSDNSMPARLYVPEAAAAFGPLLVYVHGGGFAVGDLESHDGLARLIAASGAVRVLTFEYRRAPEAPFPAGREDVLQAFNWATAQVDQLGFDPARIAIGGESAGAAHAMSAALWLRDRGGHQPAAIWVMSPALDATMSGDSYKEFATGAGRTTAEFAYLWSLYVPDEAARATPEVSPALASAAGLPPLLIYTSEFDPARSDGEDFASKARAAGVPVIQKRRIGLIHQHPEITGVSAASRAAVEDAARDLAEALTNQSSIA